MRLSSALHHRPPPIERSRWFPLLLSFFSLRSGMPVVAIPPTTFLLYRVAYPISSWHVSSTQQEEQQWLLSPLRSFVLGRPG